MGRTSFLPLEYADNCWKDKDVSFDRDRVTVNGNSTAVRRFVANRAERAVIFGNVKYLDGKNSALFSIKLNGVTLYAAKRLQAEITKDSISKPKRS